MTPTLIGPPAWMLACCAMPPPSRALPAARRGRGSASCVRGCSRRSAPHTSGVLPILDPPLRLAEFVATLALAQDNAFGQPLESQLRSCLLASWMCEAAGFDREVRDDAYWVALLRYVGCTGHAHEVATVFGDEIAIRAQTLVHDAANPTEVMGDVVAFATAGRSEEERDEIIRMLQETAHEWAVHNFTSGCEVADMLVQRLDFGPGGARGAGVHVRALERQGLPGPRGGRGDPAADARRAPQPRHGGDRPALLAGPRARGRSRAPRPHVRPGARGPVRRARTRAGSTGSARSSRGTPSSPSSPSPAGCSTGEALDQALTVAADFIDLKSPYMGGHSRRCAQLATDAARVLGLPDEAIDRAPPRGARARLRHHRGPELDLGQAGPAHADGVRPRRAPHDADRADAAPLAGAGRPEPGRVRAPREVRRVRLPQARAGRHRRSRRRACWPRRRSTWG